MDPNNEMIINEFPDQEGDNVQETAKRYVEQRLATIASDSSLINETNQKWRSVNLSTDWLQQALFVIFTNESYDDLEKFEELIVRTGNFEMIPFVQSLIHDFRSDSSEATMKAFVESSVHQRRNQLSKQLLSFDLVCNGYDELNLDNAVVCCQLVEVFESDDEETITDFELKTFLESLKPFCRALPFFEGSEEYDSQGHRVNQLYQVIDDDDKELEWCRVNTQYIFLDTFLDYGMFKLFRSCSSSISLQDLSSMSEFSAGGVRTPSYSQLGVTSASISQRSVTSTQSTGSAASRSARLTIPIVPKPETPSISTEPGTTLHEISQLVNEWKAMKKSVIDEINFDKWITGDIFESCRLRTKSGEMIRREVKVRVNEPITIKLNATIKKLANTSSNEGIEREPSSSSGQLSTSSSFELDLARFEHDFEPDEDKYGSYLKVAENITECIVRYADEQKMIDLVTGIISLLERQIKDEEIVFMLFCESIKDRNGSMKYIIEKLMEILKEGDTM